jgi:hypothetical protein
MMQAVALPPGVIAAIDKKRRAFLWAGTDKTSGSKCLVRWEAAQKPKVEGGLCYERRMEYEVKRNQSQRRHTI